MAHRYIRDKRGMQSSDEVKLDAKSLCAGSVLKSGV